MNALIFYEVLIYCFLAIFSVALLMVAWNCWMTCCTSEDDLWIAADDDKKWNASKWQICDVSSEEFTLIAIPDVRSCGVQTSGTLERSTRPMRPPRTIFASTEV
jgi:hypothetical protein